jgi:eukaryotic-like serine/threonine-protein kinase
MDPRALARFAFSLTAAAVVAAVVRDVPAATTDAAALPYGAPSATPAPPSSCSEGMVAMPSGGWTSPLRLHEAFHVAPFCLDITEVTVDSYKRCVDAGTCSDPLPYSATVTREKQCNWGRPDRGRHPINCVDWYQASSYCASLGKRLPGLPELEWATRNGDEGTLYPWGDSEPNATLLNACGPECWSEFPHPVGYDQLGLPLPQNSDRPLYSEDDGFAGTAPVGSFPKGDNRWGVHDLAGNVMEWTSTPLEAQRALFFVHGGGFGQGTFTAYMLKSFSFGEGRAADRGAILGFRCAQ